MCRIDGKTGILALIGDPVAHSLSPQIHSRFIKQAGLNLVYLAIRVKAGQAKSFFEAARLTNIVGFNVTMPLKEECFPLPDRLGPTVFGSVNTVAQRDGIFCGHNTDGIGFVKSLGVRCPRLAGVHAVILGAGGAARAIARALGNVGARVSVCSRDRERDKGIVPEDRHFGFSAAAEVCQSADLLVNATPLGMEGYADFADLSFVDSLPKTALVYDIIYAPRRTALLQYAESRGHETVNGIAHLVHQAALSFALFTGVAPDDALVRDLILRT